MVWYVDVVEDRELAEYDGAGEGADDAGARCA